MPQLANNTTTVPKTIEDRWLAIEVDSRGSQRFFLRWSRTLPLDLGLLGLVEALDTVPRRAMTMVFLLGGLAGLGLGGGR